MSEYNFKSIIIKYAKALADDQMSKIGSDYISYKASATTMLITKKGADFSTLKESDINLENIDAHATDNEVLLHSLIYLNNFDTKAIIHSHNDKMDAIARCKKSIGAPLDDAAQIIGPNLKTAKSAEIKHILKALRRRSACLVKGSGALSLGRTLAEAHTNALVLYKACKCHVDGQVLGGTVTIPYLESLVMHIVYKKKYSAKNQKLMLEKEYNDARIEK